MQRKPTEENKYWLFDTKEEYTTFCEHYYDGLDEFLSEELKKYDGMKTTVIEDNYPVILIERYRTLIQQNVDYLQVEYGHTYSYNAKTRDVNKLDVILTETDRLIRKLDRKRKIKNFFKWIFSGY